MSSELFEKLSRWCEREAEAGRHEAVHRYDLPVSARVAAGLAVDGLELVSDAGKGRVLEFAAGRNDSRLRPGSRVRLSRGDPRKPSARLELLEDAFDGRRYILKGLLIAQEEKELSGGPWVLDEDHVDLLEIELGLLERAEQGGLGAWLDGGEAAKVEPRPDAGRWGADLTGSMAEAFRRADSAENWFAVQGPPGTGKTALLARLALEAAAERGQRVLITAVSHQAIQNALSQTYWLAAQREDDPAARRLVRGGFFKLGGSKSQSAGLPLGVKAVRRLPEDGPLIAGATIYGVFSGAEWATGGSAPGFDLALFDESGQAPLVLALGARLAAGRAVFIGDDLQLPPVYQAQPEEGERDAGLSVLHMVRARYGDPWMLTETKRLNDELCAAVSESFYGGRLEPSAAAGPRRLALKREPHAVFAQVLAPEPSLVFLDIPHEGSRATSEDEARWAAAAALEALRCGLPPGEIGIVSPFRAQCNRIRFLLQSGLQGADEILVSTAERFQGQEREMVVLSLAASDGAYLAHLAGFLFSPNRLNVAVSRARTKAILIGSLDRLSAFADAADPDAGEAADGCRAFLRLSRRAARVAVSGEPHGFSAPAPAPAPIVADAPAEFPVGCVVEHMDFGVGIVVGRTSVSMDHGPEAALEVKFKDGRARVIIPSTCRPPLRLIARTP